MYHPPIQTQGHPESPNDHVNLNISLMTVGEREREAGIKTNLSSVQCYSSQSQSGDVQGAVLYEAADVTHHLPKHPGAVHKADLNEQTHLQSSGYGQNAKCYPKIILVFINSL